jgi:cytochrome P450
VSLDATEDHVAVPHLDMLAPDFRIDSEPVRAAAAEHWYATTPLGPAILGHADCIALLRDRRLRQGSLDHLASQGITSGPVAEMWEQALLCIDGEQHTRLRRLVTHAFTPGAVERIRPGMPGLVHRLIDGFAGAGRCEFMADFADRYPPTVFFDLLGVPPEEHPQFLEWGKAFGELFSFSVAEQHDYIEAALMGLYDAVDRLAALRRRHPTDDLLSRLVAASDGDDRFTARELRSMVVMLVLGGQDTTRGQLGHAMVQFAAHPDQWALLGERPELAARATEEVIRVMSVTPIIYRMTAEDLTYRDLDVPAGTRLWMMIDTAHREEAVYGQSPCDFDITVERPPQLSFGGGVHYCLGAALARVQMIEALPILATRLPGLALDGPPTFRPELSGIKGPTHLPIRFDAGNSPS